MDKAQLRAEMERLQILNTSGSRHTLWVQAFDLFNQGKSTKLRMGCGTCYTQVRNWLKS
jgi:hypothetical protein